jgi:hypothetical protein
MEENKIETPLSEMDSNVTAEETLSTNTADSDVEEVQEFDPEVEAKAQELMELVKVYNKLKRKEANKYQVSKKENKKKKAKRRMAKKSKR